MFHFFFLRNSLGLHYPKSWQPRRVSWIFQLKTFSTSKIDRIQTSYRLLCKKRNPKEYPLKFGFHLQLQRRKRKKRKKSRVYTSFQEKFPGKREKNDVAETKERASGLARFANFFSRGSHATIKERNFPVVARGRHGSSPPDVVDALWRRARAWTFACPSSTFSFPFSLPCSSRVRPQRSLLFILRYFRRSCDRLEMRRRLAGNGTEDGEARARDEGDGNEESNGLFQPGLRGPCGQESEGTRRSSAKEGEGVILPCVTRITRAALKSTRRTFYRGQS